MASYSLPDGRTVSDSMSFTYQGIQYPENWIRLSTADDRNRLGLVQLPDPPYYDQRFYTGVGQPKDLAELKAEYIAHVKRNAGAQLSGTDWVIIRSVEPGGRAAAQSILQERARIRTASDTKEAAINATTTVDELAAYVSSPAYSDWS